MKAIVISIPFLAFLCGCASAPIGSVLGGECRLPGLHTPVYAVKGKTSYDQEFVDDVTEALVRGCGQPRPKARPASLDAPAKKTTTITQPTTPIKKKHWWQR